MIIKPWNENINSRFFGMSKKPKENTILTEYTSGRATAYQKNTKKQFVYSAKIRLDLDTEGALFWEWFNDLGQTAGFFSCAALGSSVYRFINIPEPEDTDPKYLTLTLNFEEV